MVNFNFIAPPGFLGWTIIYLDEEALEKLMKAHAEVSAPTTFVHEQKL